MGVRTPVGKIISGGFDSIVMRQKEGSALEIGSLVVTTLSSTSALLQVFDLEYGSQLSLQTRELVSGIALEEDTSLELHEPHLRNYTLARLKPLAVSREGSVSLSKSMPPFFADVYDATEEDLGFLQAPKRPLFIGNVRSGSRVLKVPVYLDSTKVLSHHVLVTATTGRGKSNLTACMLWGILSDESAGVLVLDPHDEYYGRNGYGLKDHPKKERVVYYTPAHPPPGTKTLSINISILRPSHFSGVVDWTDAQQQTLFAYYKKYRKNWVKSVLSEMTVDGGFQEGTLNVVKRRLTSILNISRENNELVSHGVFDLVSGETTVSDICTELEEGKTVIIDTSLFSGATEILIGSVIASQIFQHYKHFKAEGTLSQKPVVSVVLEEAPRVLGKEVLEKGQNIFSTIAREGRKFKIGLYAITQLPSLIPRQILANMNTKIIMGVEMAPERQAIIESASQDLRDYSRAIASLDVGEAIISSHFTKFAVPVKIPLFSELVREAHTSAQKNRENVKRSFAGVGMG